MNGLKISKMQVIDNPREDAQIPIVQNGTNYSMPFGTLNKLITQIYEDYDIPNALQQLQIQIDSADAATAKAKDTAAHPGYVDNDGYYYKWNVETKTYEKTDVNLKSVAIDAAAEATTAKQNADAAADAANTAASSANTAAINAETSANNANSAIASILSDNVLSAFEKPSERSRWNDIANEKSGITSQANTYGISTELTNYNNAFQSLATYLNNGTTWSTGVPIWLADASLSTDTVIVGSTYRTNWNNYFSTRQTLLNAIYAKAKTLADAAQTQANTATTNAAAAQATANTADTNATIALNHISDLVSDNILSAVEKPAQFTEWEQAVSDKNLYDSEAITYNISTEKTDYDNAFIALANYLNGDTTWTSGTTPLWFQDLSTNTTIVGDTYRSTWLSYYKSRGLLLNKITAQAKAIAENNSKNYIDASVIVPCGNWESGTSYLKNRLVTFNNQTFISTADTSDCPIVVLADENGDYLVDKNGNYITPTDENGNITYNPSWKAYSSSEALEQDVAKFKKETSATLKILNDEINSILIRVNKLLG